MGLKLIKIIVFLGKLAETHAEALWIGKKHLAMDLVDRKEKKNQEE